MKYAIYDKAADGYLTKMEFEVGYSDNTQFECGLNEYITEAKLLDTPKEAADAIARIESFKFMEKGRFVMHSFDDELNNQYIISEAGTPTKVVDSITVDLDGTINVKYGTMTCHWSTLSLEYAINRMNALQKAKSPKYTAWCDTFDIYKVIPVIDERSCNHYQFIKVTEKGLTEYAKDEVLVVEKESTDIVESIQKEAHNWKKMYESAVEALTEVNYKNEGLTNMLKEITSYVADIMFATRTTDHDKMISELLDISNKIGVKTSDDGPMFGISVILNALINIAKEFTIWKHRAEDATMLKEQYKRQANSVYGMTIPGRCCGKQMTADVITGKKILVDKEKYDDLMECVNNISLTYEMMKIIPFSMDRPSWLSGIINRINDLTK